MSTRSYEGSELELFETATNWKAYWSSKIVAHVRGRVLDVGAGIGATAKLLASGHVDSWTALEPDPNLAERIEDAVRASRLPGSVTVRRGTLASIDASESFDTILYIDVLEHIFDDRGELLAATRHLKPGGHLIVLAPAHQWLYSPFDHAIGHHRRYSRQSLLAAAPDSLHATDCRYLDSVGMIASLANRLLLRSATPTMSQIALWDRVMVPCSRRLDPLFSGRLGKSVLGVFHAPCRRRTAAPG